MRVSRCLGLPLMCLFLFACSDEIENIDNGTICVFSENGFVPAIDWVEPVSEAPHIVNPGERLVVEYRIQGPCESNQEAFEINSSGVRIDPNENTLDVHTWTRYTMEDPLFPLVHVPGCSAEYESTFSEPLSDDDYTIVYSSVSQSIRLGTPFYPFCLSHLGAVNRCAVGESRCSHDSAIQSCIFDRWASGANWSSQETPCPEGTSCDVTDGEARCQ